MYPKGNKNQIKKLMNKDLGLKNQILKQRREDEYAKKVKDWKSQNGSVKKMKNDPNWGYSSPRPTGRFIGSEPKRLNESARFYWELDQIIKELESD